MKPKDTVPEQPQVKAKKRPYAKPKLEVYGELQRITESRGNTGKGDGGSGNTKRTQL